MGKATKTQMPTQPFERASSGGTRSSQDGSSSRISQDGLRRGSFLPNTFMRVGSAAGDSLADMTSSDAPESIRRSSIEMIRKAHQEVARKECHSFVHVPQQDKLGMLTAYHGLPPCSAEALRKAQLK